MITLWRPSSGQVHLAPHFADAGFQPAEDRLADQEMADIEFGDLRDGGELEQAADAIITLWRTKDVEEQPISLPGGGYGKKYAVLMELVKYKNGFTCEQPMWLFGHYFKFERAPQKWGLPA